MLCLNGRRFIERCQAKLNFFSSEKSFYLVMKCCEICKIRNSVIKITIKYVKTDCSDNSFNRVFR